MRADDRPGCSGVIEVDVRQQDVADVREAEALALQPGPDEPFDWPRLAPGFADLMVAWIQYRMQD